LITCRAVGITVNVVVGGKHALPQSAEQEKRRRWALHGRNWHLHGPSNDQDGEPDVVMACCGDTPTRRFWPPFPFFAHLPNLKIRV